MKDTSVANHVDPDHAEESDPRGLGSTPPDSYRAFFLL